MRRNVLTITLALIMFAGGVFAGIDIQRCKDVPQLAEFEFRLAELERYSDGLEDTGKYYRLLFDRLRYDNECAEADVERANAEVALMAEAIKAIKEERDIYYLEMHRLLNPPEH